MPLSQPRKFFSLFSFPFSEVGFGNYPKRKKKKKTLHTFLFYVLSFHFLVLSVKLYIYIYYIKIFFLKISSLDHHHHKEIPSKPFSSPPFFFFLSFYIYYSSALNLEFSLSSSTHKQLFNFLLLKGNLDEEEEDDESLYLNPARILTRSCGITFGGFLRWLSAVNGCISR